MGDPGDIADDGPGDQHLNGRSPGGRGARSAPKQQGPRQLTRGVVRNIDAWSVLKVSVVFYVSVYCMLLVAAVLLWMAATATGLRGNIEKVVADLIASGKFHFVGSELLRAGVIGGAVLVVAGSIANVMLAVLYNLISDLVGGFSILVEESPGAVPARRRRPEPALRSGTEPAPRSGTEPAPRSGGEPARVLIPEVERLSPPQPSSTPAWPPDPQLSGAERATDVNVEGLGL
ncbi:MAG TPA: DUF3566 domain-containing protein [Acidimicrobiales bacterium]|nr:DUF3566 domain-containing protein [Acidimicrobiales bacterium]